MLASPMFYEVKLSPPECALLASLVGKSLDRVTTDRWAVELRSGASAISVASTAFFVAAILTSM